ncbi:MAG: hypothetical protein KDD51_11220 [Bdellovibrionales bacterium]|nr:hypothetical protein [Bdellovibrionales bacterium]
MKPGKQSISLVSVALCLLMTARCSQDTRFTSNVLKSDVFTQLSANSQYDFLWVLDNSNSMIPVRTQVVDNLNIFLQILNSRKAIDYRMAATTTDYISHAGALVSNTNGLRVVTSGSVDPIGDFASIVNNVQNTATSFWEQGLESAYKAVQNQGSLFMRTGVPLIVIFLTDEDDYSCQANCFGEEPETNPNDVVYPTSRYINFFKDGLAAGGTSVMMFPIVGDPETSSCTPYSYGLRYMEVQTALESGQSGSICPAEVMESYNNIARVIADLGVRFPLSNQASGSNIAVYVDNVEIPYSEDDGYVYEASTNSIVFTGNSIPQNGQTIEILYTEQTGA